MNKKFSLPPLLLIAAQASFAFSGITEVIVTAQKQDENMQDIPIAISAMTSEQLETGGITDFGSVARSSPSLSIQPYPNSSNTLLIYMRGQGLDDPGQITRDGAVGLYEDGFYLARPQASTFDMADVERVEILRGPQGTLYGRNTTGGAVNIISKQPTGKFGLKQDFTFGTRDLFRSLTAINFPEVWGLSTKVTLLKSSIDGYVKNAGSGHDYGEEEQKAGRVMLHWTALDNLAVDYFFDKGNFDSTPPYPQAPLYNGFPLYNPTTPYYANPNGPMTRTYRPVDLKQSTSNSEGNGLTVSWDINNDLTLKSLTGYRKLYWEAYQDYVETYGIPYATDDPLNQHQFSQEFQLIGNLLDGQINYVGGLYYFDESVSHTVITDLSSLAMTQEKKVKASAKSKAIFGQVSWTPEALGDRLRVTGGARYTKDKKSAERFSSNSLTGILENGGEPTTAAPNGAANNLSFSKFNPMFTIDYQWAPDLNTYAKISTGYKAGGSEDLAPIGQFTQTFGPEKLTNYEIGLKSYWLDHRLRFNLAAYDSKYEGIQLELRSSPNAFDYQAYNAGRATIRGVELELVFQPMEDLSFAFDANYLHGVIDKVDVQPNTVFDPAVNPASPYQRGDNLKGLFAIPYSPKYSLDLSADYTFYHFDGGSASAHLDYRWQDEIMSYGPDFPGRQFGRQDSFGLLNGQLMLSFDLPHGDKARVSLWGKNLAHKEYLRSVSVTGGGFVALQSTDPATGAPTGPVTPAGFTASNGGVWAEPASYGIRLIYEY